MILNKGGTRIIVIVVWNQLSGRLKKRIRTKEGSFGHVVNFVVPIMRGDVISLDGILKMVKAMMLGMMGWPKNLPRIEIGRTFQ